ncbi:hypothetical protein [Mycobacteroides abscessus]|uniref:hypothetical protein n=1 Tax=Mycobacteroides abscessus TaxID=36809 RepID=UPI0010424DA6|nr:hypothetical protein [Mycobacteroides abscessus]
MLVATGCHTAEKPIAPPTTLFPNWPEKLNDFRFRWTADPGIDMLTGPAVPIRAYLESWFIGFVTGTPSQNLYPGFDRAVPVKFRPGEASSILPGPYSGNDNLHILEITPVDNGYSAYVCEGRYDVFSPSRDAPEVYEGGLVSFDIIVWKVDVKRTGEKENPELQTGPLPAPADDVFNGWSVDMAEAGYKTIWGKKFDELIMRCDGKLPANSNQRASIRSQRRDTPQKAESAIPGWPNSPA